MDSGKVDNAVVAVWEVSLDILDSCHECWSPLESTATVVNLISLQLPSSVNKSMQAGLQAVNVKYSKLIEARIKKA